MSISDDELDRLYRAANPAPADEYAPLRAKDIALREDIIRGAASVAPPRRTGWAWAGFTTATAAIAVAMIVVASVLTPSQQAVALTPAPLEYTDPRPLDEVVADADAALAAESGPQQQSQVQSLTWAWNIDMADQDIEVVPQRVSFDWSPEGGSTTLVVAGDSLWTDSDRPAELSASPYTPGEVLSESVIPPGEFTAPAEVLAVNGADREGLVAALTALGAPPGASSGAMLVAIGQLLNFWTLDDQQHALLLDLLMDAGGVTVLGETTDRAGRDVVGLRVTDDSSLYRDTVLVSIDTGRIVGMENELERAQGFIPAGVVGYTLWDDPQG